MLWSVLTLKMGSANSIWCSKIFFWCFWSLKLAGKLYARLHYLFITIQGVFLYFVLFNLTSRSYFRSDIGDRPINLSTLLCAIAWDIDHNSIITLCRVKSQYVKAVFFVKIDFSKIELKFPILKFSCNTRMSAKTCCDRFQILYKVSKYKIGKFTKIRES